MLIEREVGDQPFQPVVFVLERSQLPQLADAQVGVFLLPNVQGGFADLELPADIGGWCSALDLAEGIAICSPVNFDFFMGPRPW